MLKTYVFDLNELPLPEKFSFIVENLKKLPLFYEVHNDNLIACGYIENGEKRKYQCWVDLPDELMRYEAWNKFTEDQAICYYEEFLHVFEDACVQFMENKNK